MRYDEAFKIGSVCDGYVKCTYAELYRENGTKLFSLQRRNGVDWRTSAEEKIYVEIEFPMVTAEYSAPVDGKIPCRLTKEAANYILACLKDKYKRTDNLFAMVQAGDLFYVKACAMDWKPTDVKDFYITDPKTGKQVRLEDALEDARKRMENAKNLLIASPSTLLF